MIPGEVTIPDSYSVKIILLQVKPKSVAMKRSLILIAFFLHLTVFGHDSVVEYYNEIAGKSEYGDPTATFCKWKKDVKIFFDFEDSDTIKKYTEEIIKDLNDLIYPISISITNKKSEANLVVYCGNFLDYKKRYNVVIEGQFNGFTCTNTYNSTIYSGYVFINERLKGVKLKSVIREEITQSFGLANDSWKYPDSIFFQGANTQITFSEIDKAIIKMHYNNLTASNHK